MMDDLLSQEEIEALLDAAEDTLEFVYGIDD